MIRQANRNLDKDSITKWNETKHFHFFLQQNHFTSTISLVSSSLISAPRSIVEIDWKDGDCNAKLFNNRTRERERIIKPWSKFIAHRSIENFGLQNSIRPLMIIKWTDQEDDSLSLSLSLDSHSLFNCFALIYLVCFVWSKKKIQLKVGKKNRSKQIHFRTLSLFPPPAKFIDFFFAFDWIKIRSSSSSPWVHADR